MADRVHAMVPLRPGASNQAAGQLYEPRRGPRMDGKNAEPLRVAIIGTSRRADYLYGPLLQALPDVELVAVWGRSEASAARLGASLGVPAYTDLDRLIRETNPAIGVVAVSSAANDEVGLMAAEAGLHLLV